ncbi:hypothetical protein GGS20DRAFT_586439 [Poronia punctata]|nr:hypothetical protein GGS20DRAFT_586439 [Poronia punctata]
MSQAFTMPPNAPPPYVDVVRFIDDLDIAMSIQNGNSSSPSPAAPSTSEEANYPGEEEEITELAPWQKRWNLEWLHEAFIPHLRHIGCHKIFPRKFLSSCKKQACPRHQIKKVAKDLWDRCRLHGSRKTWKTVAILEECGDNPRWEGELTIKWIRKGSNSDPEFFPGPENIKWAYTFSPSGDRWLHGDEVSDRSPRVPFVLEDGQVLRNVKATATLDIADEETFGGERSCRHCGGKDQ